MRRLRSVRARLALALFFVVMGALAVVYLIVVPSLERRLVDDKLAQLDEASIGVTRQLPSEAAQWGLFVENQSKLVNARVVIYEVTRTGGRVDLRNVADSGTGGPLVPERDPIAVRAAETALPQASTRGSGDDRVAEAARPVGRSADTILVLASSLREPLANVRLVERRLVLAGLVALAVALLGGYAAAWGFARRIRRLERAADRIAGGRFDEPVEDRGADELGELAEAFDQMRQRLAQLEHARREFIANASHELRTPLFSLGGFLELLREEELDDETRAEFLESMRDQISRLTRLATDLLDLSRLDAGRIRVDREPVDLVELAHALVSEFRAVARAESRSLEADAETPVWALGDEQRILQIGRILVENALVHTPEGTRISVRTVVRGDEAELAVEDDGPGIPPDHAAHVFDRFYRVDGAVASGSGLGLAIARELAGLMDGELRLESRPGRTVFRLVLPEVSPKPSPAESVALLT
jgi:two-component system OmpR family sensor kinase